MCILIYPNLFQTVKTEPNLTLPRVNLLLPSY